MSRYNLRRERHSSYCPASFRQQCGRRDGPSGRKGRLCRDGPSWTIACSNCCERDRSDPPRSTAVRHESSARAGVAPVSAPTFYTAPVVPLPFRKVLPLLALRIYLSEGEAETWSERAIQNRGGLSNRRWRWSLLSERRLHRV